MIIIRNIALEMLPDVWPMIIIITVILASLRITYILNSNKKFSLFKELISLIAIIYMLCLFHVVTYQDINYGLSNFIPFKEIFRYDIGSELFIKNVLGNILLFIPYGFFVCYFLKNKKLPLIIILTTIVSTTIEIVQYYIGRVFDIDDIILNVCGGIVGCFLYILLDKIKHKLPKAFRNDTFTNLIIIIIIVLIIMCSFNLNIFSWFN